MKEMMLKIWEKVKIILQWIMAVFCFLGAIVEIGVSSLFLLIAGILFLPVKKIRVFLMETFKMKGTVACLMAVVFFFVGASIFPSDIENVDNIASTGSEYSSVLGNQDSSSSNQTPPATDNDNSSNQTPPVTDSSGSSNQTSSSTNNHDHQNKVTYILNTNTKKIHYVTCGEVKKISEKNKKEVTTTLEELLGSGYATCKKCFK